MESAQATRVDLPGLLTTLSIDLPTSVRTVKLTEAQHWGVGLEQLFARAIDNLVEGVKPQIQTVETGSGPPLRVLESQSFFTASLALVIDNFTDLIGKHGAFVSLPVRNMLVSLPFETIDALKSMQAMVAITHGLERDGPGSISNRIYWYHEGKWVHVPIMMDEKGIHVTPPEELVAKMNEIAGEGEA